MSHDLIDHKIKRNALIALTSALSFLTIGAGVALVGPGEPRMFAVVEEGFLYRSGQIQEDLLRPTLVSHGIQQIVNLGVDKDKPDQLEERRVADAFGMIRSTYFLKGNGTGPFVSYVNAVEHIHEARKAGRRILVHCSAGAQRTSGAIAFYQLLVQNKPIEEVIAHLRDFHDYDDNPDLIPYLNQHMGDVAQGLVERGVIAKAPEPLPQFPWPK